MPWHKTQKIGKHYNSSFVDLLKGWYERDKLSGEAITEKIQRETGMRITSRSIYLWLQKLGMGRDKSTARKIGIQEGRVDYEHLRKSIKSKEFRLGISLQTRYAILKRDNFRCVLCGDDAQSARLVVDHIIPVVRGGTNDITNLRTLCTACNHGKMLYEKEK